MKKYDLPEFLVGVVSKQKYERWLHRKALAHVRRDRDRGNTRASTEEYKLAIHKAVKDSNGVDAYTAERLEWTLLSKYRDEDSKKGRREYKHQFALLPSVDHVGDGTGPADFRICAWRTNDAKGDLPYQDFLDLCRRVLRTADGRSEPA